MATAQPSRAPPPVRSEDRKQPPAPRFSGFCPAPWVVLPGPEVRAEASPPPPGRGEKQWPPTWWQPSHSTAHPFIPSPSPSPIVLPALPAAPIGSLCLSPCGLPHVRAPPPSCLPPRRPPLVPARLLRPRGVWPLPGRW